ncbi:hypothetical protein KGD83_22870 [Nocardiopsis akebiae]|uniref:D-isomer specific 2-hydroxyacid dehydrogenase NAD-binding domain-containing protein n=1 Tax=Nocardiopsis akebiae TaxID=2831968 RepID=A0ABX8C103_9ACTN|nr:hypothetical protein KGD83_22870 [Nocardiopsis akebiae]
MFVPERGRVLVSGRFEPDERDRIRAAAAGAPVDFVDGLGDRADLLGTATVIAGTLSGEHLALAPAVRWVHSWAAGVNNDLAAGLDAHPAVLTSSAGNGAVPLAEHAMMLMLMLNRDAPRWARAQSEHRWERFQHGELNGLTCGIIGLGNCGLDLAAKARAFHMRVVGCGAAPACPPRRRRRPRPRGPAPHAGRVRLRGGHGPGHARHRTPPRRGGTEGDEGHGVRRRGLTRRDRGGRGTAAGAHRGVDRRSRARRPRPGAAAAGQPLLGPAQRHRHPAQRGDDRRYAAPGRGRLRREPGAPRTGPTAGERGRQVRRLLTRPAPGPGSHPHGRTGTGTPGHRPFAAVPRGGHSSWEPGSGGASSGGLRRFASR